jgi:lipopolysaccharide transport system ATP-binding protein
MPVAISVENLSKKYLISHQRKERYTALRDVIAGNAKALGRRLLHPIAGNGSVTGNDATTEEFWALKDLSFEVQEGDRVGIIGRNGAGKSTLLKILARVTEPTSGRVRITGRVASLLEVGTGFHPELTGRENIYLNGAILGMSRHEIRRKFDEIVDFAEVETFLDTPVKRYSSGMYMRLAFSVAAWLEPEILMVDEVLAVGDAQFQRKSLGRMEEVSKEGRTVLFVSHNISAITSLCNKSILLASGRLVSSGDTEPVIAQYLSTDGDLVYESRRPASLTEPRIVKAWFEHAEGGVTTQFRTGAPICVVLELDNPSQFSLEVNLSFYDSLRRPLWNFSHQMYHFASLPKQKSIRVRLTFLPPTLTVSDLVADIAIGPKGGDPYFDHIVGALKCAITQESGDEYRVRYPNWPILCDVEMNVEADRG